MLRGTGFKHVDADLAQHVPTTMMLEFWLLANQVWPVRSMRENALPPVGCAQQALMAAANTATARHTERAIANRGPCNRVILCTTHRST